MVDTEGRANYGLPHKTTNSRRKEDITIERTKGTKKLKIVFPHCIMTVLCNILMGGRFR